MIYELHDYKKYAIKKIKEKPNAADMLETA